MDQTTTEVLLGLRCADPLHPEIGTVYGTCLDRARAVSLAQSVPCYELVASHDGGNTWQPAGTEGGQ